MFDPQEITEWTIAQISWHMQSLHMRLFWGSEPAAEPPYSIQLWQARQSSPLREEIALLCRAANGAIDRQAASAETLGEIAETVQSIVEATAAPTILNAYTIEDAYWSTPIGELIAVVLAWQRGDDLMSYMDAGRLLVAAGLTPYPPDRDLTDRERKSLAERVRRLAEGERVRRYRNPAPSGEARGDWLLSKSEVEQYIAGRLAELGEDGE